MFRKELLLLFFLFLFFLFGCDPEKVGKEEEYKPFKEGAESGIDSGSGDTGGEIVASEDKLFEKEGSEIVLKTNNLKYWSVRGYTLWKFFGEEISHSEPSVMFVKESGEEEAGYGLGCYSTKLESGQKDYNMLSILIYTTGEYSIGYVENGDYHHIVWKESCSYLNEGMGIKNTISVKRDDENIYIYLNNESCDGDATYKLSDLSDYDLGLGEVSLIGIVSPKDKFPDRPVCLKYEVRR